MKNSKFAIAVIFLFLSLSIGPILVDSASALRFTNLNLKDADASFYGEKRDSEAGNAVDVIGDINGDGFDDLAIGAHYDDEAFVNAGQVYIFFGKASGWSIDLNLANANASFRGENKGDIAGDFISGVGDVNGDGYDDFTIAATGRSNQKGEVYLILGKKTGWSKDVNLSTSDASFIGESDSNELGSLGPAGDVNGDGLDDFLIGCPYHAAGGKGYSGKAYLFFGRKTGWAMDKSVTTANASFNGSANSDYTGRSVSGIGDVNGDGFDDIMFTAVGPGKAFLFFGKTSGWTINTPVWKSNASFKAENPSDNFGTSVSGGGDVNGDGYDDFIIGAPWRDENSTNAGQAYLVFGKSSGWANNVSISKADASFTGNMSNCYLGLSVLMPGDLNRDGYDDIVISGYTGTSITGDFIVLGKPSGWSMDTNITKADARISGESADDYNRLGRYHGDVNRDGYNDLVIGAYGRDEYFISAGMAYLVFPEIGTPPSAITSIKAYSDPACTKQISKADIDQTVYLELVGTDANSSRADVAVVNLTSSSTDPLGFRVVLKETGANTGRFQGNFTTNAHSYKDRQWIGVTNGETVVATSLQDPTKKVSLTIEVSIKLRPKLDIKDATEDQPYKSHYWVVNGVASQWTFHTNADWLLWNSTTHNISGTPDNGDVGASWVCINVTDGSGHYDEHNFTLTVKNVRPRITTNDVKTALEDSIYSVTYSSDDDPTTTWSSKTNASWLGFNPSTRVLSGTPAEKDIGSYWVNVSVDDGHGGKNSTNFTLKVNNAPPRITSPDVKTVVEDTAYSNDYSSDDDPTTTFSFKSNSDFLTIVGGTGVLAGTPDNSDVGKWYVNVSVKDKGGLSAFSNFTLNVTNVAPDITTGDLTSALEDVTYSNDYTSTDDPTTTWIVVTDADFLSINKTTGLLNGTPDNGDVGNHYVNVTVDDGNGGKDFTNFTLVIGNTGPVITTANSLLAREDVEYLIDYNCSDDTIGGPDIVRWTLRTNATWLTLNKTTGVLKGTPDNSNVGWYWVNVSVDDGNGAAISTNFTLTVLNADPIIQTQDVVSVLEDSEFFVHYTCDDDGQGNVVWSLVTIAPWLKFDPIDGILNGTPDNSMVGRWDIKVSVDDGNGGKAERTFILTVVNKPPEITTVPVTGIYERSEYLVDLNSTDDGKGIIYWTMPKGPTWLGLNSETGTLKGTPGTADVGQNDINIQVSDGNGGIGYLNYTLTVLNVDDPATWTRVPTDTVMNKGETFTFDVDAIDPDQGRGHKFGISSVPASSITIDPITGLITWVPTEYGSYNVTITYGDEKQMIYHRFTIIVNTPPVATLISPKDKGTIEVLNPAFQWSVTDAEGDKVLSDLYVGTDLAGIQSLDHKFRIGASLNDTFFVPGSNLEKGTTYYWTVIPNDGWAQGTCSVGIWSFSIAANATVNTPPRFTSTPGLDAKVGVQWNYTPTAVDDDPGDQATITLISGPEGMMLGSGVLKWVPRDDQVGTYKVKLQANDGKSGVYQEFMIIVTKDNIVINHPPVIKQIDPVSVKEGKDVRFTLIATDQDGDTITFELVSGPKGVIVYKDGTFIWKTKKGDAGEYDIVVRASDGVAQNVTTVHVKVDKTPERLNGVALGTVLPMLLVIIVAMGIIAFLVASRRKKGRADVVGPKAIPTKKGPGATGPARHGAGAMGLPQKERKKAEPAPTARQEEEPVPASLVEKVEERPHTEAPKAVEEPKAAVVESVDIEDLEEEEK